MITLEDLNTETLNEEYAFEFWKCYKQLPKAEVLNRAILISRIKSMQNTVMNILKNIKGSLNLRSYQEMSW